MKCSVHEDQTVIMVCQEQQCETFLVCVLCVTGPHSRHKMATLEEAGKVAKKRLEGKSTKNIEYLDDQKKKLERIHGMEQVVDRNQNDAHKMMEAQSQQMHETVDKVIAHMTSQYEVKYERRLKELKDIKQRTRDSIKTVQILQESLGEILETDDWPQIIQDEKTSKTSPKTEDLPEDSTPGVAAEEINKTLVTGVLAALQQCQPQSRSMTDADHTSDFEGTVYKHKSLHSVASFTLPGEDTIRCIVLVGKISHILSCIEKIVYIFATRKVS